MKEEIHLTQALDKSFIKLNNSNVPEFRVSSFPYCPILSLVDYLDNSQKFEHYSQKFYFKIGSAVHELWQQAMADCELGHTVYGNWKCNKCEKIVFRRTKPHKECCKDSFWLYEEISYDYKGLSGHSDLVTVNDERNYTLWELKTVPLRFINSNLGAHDYEMYPRALNQALIYGYLARKIYRIPITRIAIVQTSRERPWRNSIKIGYADFNKDVYKQIKRQLNRAFDGERALGEITKKDNLSSKLLQPLIDSRPCHNENQYRQRMDKRWYGSAVCPVYKLGCCTKDKTGNDLKEFLKSMWKKNRVKP